MVTFTCNTCGDSLKKKEVTTHFQRKFNCRQAASLACFDCLKEFGLDYDSHTVCITEDQRYSSGGLNGVSKNKQQEWTELVHNHVKSVLIAQKSTLSKSVINALEYVCKTASVPKKEKAFFNFLRNARRFVENDIRAAWNIVQEVQKQVDAAKKNDTQKNGLTNGDTNGVEPTTNGKAHSPVKSKSAEPMEEEAACEESKAEVEGEQKKKKKKSKKSEASEEVTETTTTEEVANDLNESKESKKQKKKKEKLADTSQVSEETPMEVEEVSGETGAEAEKLSKKEKKLKKKQEKFEAELKAVEAEKPNEEEAEDLEEPAEEGKKKKKSKRQVLDAEENLESDRKSKKKRERTVSMAAETEQPKKKNKQKNYDENTEPNEVEEDFPGRKDFNWNNVIIEVLKSQDNKEMSIKRLCKKVVNEYLSSLLEGAHVDEVKATAKFQKKLYKTPGVYVHKDKAKLKATDEDVKDAE